MANKQTKGDFASVVAKSFGNDIIKIGANIAEVEQLSTGVPDLDECLEGGIPKGILVELFGKEGSGKTWILLKTYAEAQKKGLRCCHIDAECSYNLKWAAANGVDNEKITVIDKLKTAEECLQFIDMACEHKAYDVIGLDSVASLVTEGEEEAGYQGHTMGSLARTLSTNLKKIVKKAFNSGITVVFINQLRETMNPYGEKETTPGGRSLKHHVSLRIETKKSIPKAADRPDLYEATPQGDLCIGHILTCTIKKSRISIPNKKVQIDLRYKPLSRVNEILLNSLDKEILVKNKSNHKIITYVDNNGEDHKIVLPQKGDYESLIENLRERGIICEVFNKAGVSDEELDSFVDSEILKAEEVDAWKNKDTSEPKEEKKTRGRKKEKKETEEAVVE